MFGEIMRLELRVMCSNNNYILFLADTARSSVTAILPEYNVFSIILLTSRYVVNIVIYYFCLMNDL